MDDPRDDDVSEADVAKWRLGSWTREKVDELEEEADTHIEACEECQANLDEWGGEEEDSMPTFCAVGDSLTETHMQALLEYSHQPDFAEKVRKPISSPCCPNMEAAWEGYAYSLHECGQMGWQFKIEDVVIADHVEYCQWCGSQMYE